MNKQDVDKVLRWFNIMDRIVEDNMYPDRSDFFEADLDFADGIYTKALLKHIDTIETALKFMRLMMGGGDSIRNAMLKELGSFNHRDCINVAKQLEAAVNQAFKEVQGE